MKLVYYILVFVVVGACTRDVDVEIDHADEQIVVEGRIETGEAATVLLTRSAAIFEEFDINDVNNYMITDAIITVSNGVNEDTLKPVIDLNSFPPLIYKASVPSFVGEEEETYYLKILIDQKELLATTTIPGRVGLDSAWIREEQGFKGKGFVWAHFDDPDTLGNGYKWEQKTTQEEKFVSPIGMTFDDRIFNGKSFDFFAQKPFDPDEEGVDPTTAIFYDITDTVIIKFSALDKGSFDFWRTLDLSKSNNGNPFASPITPLTNISGGLGVFTGYSVTFDTVVFKP